MDQAKQKSSSAGIPDSGITIQLESYGPARDYFGHIDSLTIAGSGQLADLIAALCNHNPAALELIQSSRFVLQNSMMTHADRIQAGQTVGILPPFSGG